MKAPKITLVIILFFQLGCTSNSVDQSCFNGFNVEHVSIGPSPTNCYLIYDRKSKEAAIIDPGWRDNTLVNYIKENKLMLKYILLTHGHKDHLFGVPNLKKQFPKAKLCLNRLEVYDPQFVGMPDVFVEDNQVFRLGCLEIRTVFAPGHSAGGICYYAGAIIFSGDVLFYKNIGLHPDGSKVDLLRSVAMLLKRFPDSIVVYPGHGPSTTIGLEKSTNKKLLTLK